MSERAEHALDVIHRQLLAFAPQTLAEHVVHGEALVIKRALLAQRRARDGLHGSAVQPAIWAVIVVGTLLSLSFPFVCGGGNFRAHLIMTIGLGVAMGLVLFIIVALDFPFRGTVNIGPEPLQKALVSMERLAQGGISPSPSR